MSTLTKPYAFTAGTYAVAQQVNSDFDAVFGWINGGGAIWSDGSVAFSVVPTGPAVDPTTDNQLARKAYVDARAASGALRDIAGTNPVVIRANSVIVSLSAGGSAEIDFGNPFPNNCFGVVVSNGDTGAQPNATLGSAPIGPSRFTVSAKGNSAGNVRVNYIAFGN